MDHQEPGVFLKTKNNDFLNIFYKHLSPELCWKITTFFVVANLQVNLNKNE